MDKEFETLLEEAKKTVNKRQLTEYLECGRVSCALMTTKGNIYTGINIDAKCALGNCAEQAAILEMLKNGETEIKKILAYSYKDYIYSPCGKCRELIRMIDEKNLDTQALVLGNQVKTIRELMPDIFTSQEEREGGENNGAI